MAPVTLLEEPTWFIDNLRLVNVILAAIALIVMVVMIVLLAKPRWKTLSASGKLVWLSLFCSCVSACYGTFEIKYLSTNIRVPMVTVSMLWVLLAGFIAWKEDRHRYWRRKK